MQHFKYTLLSMFVSLLCSACNERELPAQVPQLVVEGYIDDGGFPVVMLTTTFPVSTVPQRTDSIVEHLLRWAKVTVSDGEQDVVLTGMADEAYFPPFVYTTSRLRGQAGRKYMLRVEYEGFSATAVTTIPAPPIVDSLIVMPTEVDSLFSLRVYLKDTLRSLPCYMVFVRSGVDGRQWLPAYLGLKQGVQGEEKFSIVVNKPWSTVGSLEYSPFFCRGDTVGVKVSRIDEQVYLFWKDYANSVNFQRNPLMPFSENAHSNINGGIGCWYGCGSVKIPVLIK